MFRKKWFYIIFVVFVLIIVGLVVYVRKPEATAQNAQQRIPTLYVYGFGGTHNSTDYPISQAVKHAGANKVLTATVHTNGKVTYQGSWQNQRYPIIQVIFQNNHAQTIEVAGYLKDLTQSLQQRYHVQTFNGVGHSSGSVGLVHYAIEYQHTNLPKLHKLVTMAGHFNGFIGGPGKGVNPNTNQLLKSGLPKYENTEYKWFVANAGSAFAKTQILNIYGNLEDGSHSDGSVINVSSLSFRGILKGRDQSYQELMFKKLHHSQLHQSAAVAQSIDQFIYNTK